MKQTTFEEFVELVAARHVRAGVPRDHGRPADAGLGVSQDRRALRLRVPARERRRRRARRPLFVPRQGSVPRPARPQRRDDHRTGRRADASGNEPFIDVLRGADGGVLVAVRAGPAAVHGRRGRLLRLRHRRVVRAGRARSTSRRRRSRPGRVHGLRHGAGVRSRQAPDSGDRQRPAARRARTCAASTTSRARRSISSSASSSGTSRAPSGAPSRGARASRQPDARDSSKPSVRKHSGRHRRRRDLPGRALAAIRGDDAARRRSTSIARFGTSTRRRTCSSSAWDATRSSARRRRCSCASRAGTSRRIRSPARGAAARRRTRISGWPRSCGATRRSAPSTSCSSTSAATTSGASPKSAACGCRSSWRSSATRTSCTWCRASKAGCAEDRDRLDALVATFPAGTLTGAPKIRAMQIIGGLEPTRRGLYGGAVGYLDFAGNLDFCIAIRTITMRGRPRRDPGRRRHRRRLASGGRVRRDARQGARADPGARDGRIEGI